MKRALEISRFGLGYVSPNPMVGCVLVKDGKLIGEGWHKQVGQAHAEVNAIASVSDRSLLEGSTAYVTLEPCSHHGRTPPCTDLLIKVGVKRVVISLKDPFEKVNGSGVAKLRENGVAVDVGLQRDDATFINRRFLVNVNQSRPYVVLKWAQTSDAFIARKNFDSRWISNEQSRQLVHKWRAAEDGILVGYNTAKYDNPALNVRTWTGRDPMPVYIDPKLELKDIQLFGRRGICINEMKSEKQGNCYFVKVNDSHDIQELLRVLYKLNIYSLFVEGGSKTLQSFLQQGLWDEARVFIASTTFEEGIPAPHIEQEPLEAKKVGMDRLEVFFKD